MNGDILFENVSFYRGSRCIYDNVSFTIPAGKITSILGPSGSGKTTVLQLISGLIRPSSGSICIDNISLNRRTKEKELENLRRKMGFLFQSGALFTHLNVFENVAFPLLKNTNLSQEIIRNVVLLKLQAVGLAYTVNMMPSELSGGMARRVALARSIALDPNIMMYDEPFTGQDPASFNKLLELISTLNNSLNMTSIIVSHDIEESLNLSDHIIIVGNKKILASDSPSNIKNSSDPNIQAFISGKAIDSSESDKNNEEKSFFTKQILESQKL